jgi:hypothetical protein
MEDCRIARQVAEWNPPGGNGGAGDQSAHGRTGLGTACKAETSRMKKISIKSSGGKNIFVWNTRKKCTITQILKRLHICRRSMRPVKICNENMAWTNETSVLAFHLTQN